MVHYNLGLIFVALTVVSLAYYNFVPIKVITVR